MLAAHGGAGRWAQRARQSHRGREGDGHRVRTSDAAPCLIPPRSGPRRRDANPNVPSPAQVPPGQVASHPTPKRAAARAPQGPGLLTRVLGHVLAVRVHRACQARVGALPRGLSAMLQSSFQKQEGGEEPSLFPGLGHWDWAEFMKRQEYSCPSLRVIAC